MVQAQAQVSPAGGQVGSSIWLAEALSLKDSQKFPASQKVMFPAAQGTFSRVLKLFKFKGSQKVPPYTFSMSVGQADSRLVTNDPDCFGQADSRIAHCSSTRSEGWSAELSVGGFGSDGAFGRQGLRSFGSLACRAMHEVHGRARDCVCSHILAFGGVVYEDMRSRVQQDRALMENKYPRVSLAP